MTNPADIRDLLLQLTGPDLTQTLARIERAMRGVEARDCASFLEGAGVGREALAAEAEMKRLAGQINVTIHALGYLTPRAFASTFTATGDRLRNPDQLRRSTVDHPAHQRHTHPRSLASAG
ncbi:hypothetical protein [Beijerinckia indica]|uniref:Uncharacterized protein n=1 Tax=Beijerinckia indica subsp. indica (strain ATCC 9039 / DSM 1715 / NCIMB 8712) TaxID=395963 RepID=B2IKH8_BEII9|nr:hypothetical protein Bind_2889 [Beijerinckia indica subsp. indica ATCC 9039]